MQEALETCEAAKVHSEAALATTEAVRSGLARDKTALAEVLAARGEALAAALGRCEAAEVRTINARCKAEA